MALALTVDEMLPLMEGLRAAATSHGNLFPEERLAVHALIEAARGAGFTDIQIGVLLMMITQPLGRHEKDAHAARLVTFLGE